MFVYARVHSDFRAAAKRSKKYRANRVTPDSVNDRVYSLGFTDRVRVRDKDGVRALEFMDRFRF